MLLLNLNKIRTAQERIRAGLSRPDQFETDEDFRVVAPVSLAFDIFKDKQAFRLVGPGADDARAEVQPVPRTVHGAGGPGCSTCGTSPHAENTGEGEREIEEDDLTTAFYENDEIDLGQLMHEQFVLSLPMKPLCERRVQGAVPGLRHEPESKPPATASASGKTRVLPHFEN